MTTMRLATKVVAILLLAGGCSPNTDQSQTQDISTADSVDVMQRSSATVGDDSVWVLPLPALGYNAREGSVLFNHYCAVCHGAEGSGDGFNAFNLDPKPRDLADPQFQADRSDDDLSDIIRSGGAVAGLSNGMPPWGKTINDRGIKNIVVFLRTLPDSVP